MAGPSASSEQASHREVHRTESIGWLRAAVLGANDGLISTGSLVVGVAVSVSSQSDTERADLARERKELATMPETEHAELTEIYVARGLTRELASQVALQLAAHDVLGAHARDELGIHAATRARPLQAALASAAAFAVGATPPLLLAALWPPSTLSPVVMGSSLFLLALLGAAAARLGGAPLGAGAFRVTLWGAVAMAATTLVGRLFGAVG